MAPTLTFPSQFFPDLTTRAGRMMEAGRVKVTVSSSASGEHVTVLLKCIADNRQRQFDPMVNKNWIECTRPNATHVFAEVPNADGWNDKIGTFYPKSGRWYDADNADPARVFAACAVAQWLVGETPVEGMQVTGTFLTFQEAEECGVCGRELTDPESIARGIGPVCYGKVTGSQHQVKEPPTYFDGDTPGHTWEGTPHASQELVTREQLDLEDVEVLTPEVQGADTFGYITGCPVAGLTDEQISALMVALAEETARRVESSTGFMAR